MPRNVRTPAGGLAPASPPPPPEPFSFAEWLALQAADGDVAEFMALAHLMPPPSAIEAGKLTVEEARLVALLRELQERWRAWQTWEAGEPHPAEVTESLPAVCLAGRHVARCRCDTAPLDRRCLGCGRRLCADCQPETGGTRCRRCGGPVWGDGETLSAPGRNPANGHF